MKCDFCDREATVREVTVRNGVRVERHLCDQHAAELGIAISPSQPIGEIIKQVRGAGVTGATPGAAPAGATAKPKACPGCGTTFSEFKQHGLLGCAGCYTHFEPQLASLLERAHEGGTAHVGKKPRRAGAGEAQPEPARSNLAELEARAQRLRMIREELDRAVRAEQYEQAARLRDEIKRLSEGPPRGG
jgi:protein arginine kinase activator